MSSALPNSDSIERAHHPSQHLQGANRSTVLILLHGDAVNILGFEWYLQPDVALD